MTERRGSEGRRDVAGGGRSSSRPRRAGRVAAAFTLFEVAISAALVASAATVVLMVIPIGLRAQHQARFQLYAGCKVLEMMDTFANHDHTYASRQLEGVLLGQNAQPLKWPIDLDRMMMNQQLGLLPLPEVIARRIDSDGDEMARIVNEGGRLYYASPQAYEVGFHQHSGGYNLPGPMPNERVAPSEAKTVIFGIAGYAQQNGLANHPCIAWPYGANFPSTPTSGGSGHNIWAWQNNHWEYLVWAKTSGANPPNLNRLGIPSAAQDEFMKMCAACPSWEYHFANLPYLRDKARLQAYIDASQKLVQLLGVDCTGAPPYLMPVAPKDLTTIAKPWYYPGHPDSAHLFPDPRHISAIRWLAAGALMRTGYYISGRDGSVPIWPVTAQDIKYAKDLEEICMRWGRRYASMNPYDWGSPRALNRCSSWDFPLLQFDLFAPHAVGDGAVDLSSPPRGDVTWKITAPRKPRNYHSGYAVIGAEWHGVHADNFNAIDTSWATKADGTFDDSRFNLTEPFAAAERCRQIVCWAVDWQAYQDFETAPTGGYDASMAFMDSRGGYVDAEIANHPPDLTLSWNDASRTTRFPRPSVDVHYVPDATDPSGYRQVGAEPFGTAQARRGTAAYRAAFFGLWGADRNGNGVLDQGPLPPGARVRAVSIGRWNFYDRRMVSALRN
ncbi:MAG TPA: hypothetical protein VEL07_03155 [Planctomycetota bacterium]|nr:hypothetical protein [Planctomycetota bacterium]